MPCFTLCKPEKRLEIIVLTFDQSQENTKIWYEYARFNQLTFLSGFSFPPKSLIAGYAHFDCFCAENAIYLHVQWIPRTDLEKAYYYLSRLLTSMIGKYLMIVFTQLRGFEEYISWIVLRLTIDINHNVFLVCVISTLSIFMHVRACMHSGLQTIKCLTSLYFQTSYRKSLNLLAYNVIK